jgi:hypothetical protein
VFRAKENRLKKATILGILLFFCMGNHDLPGATGICFGGDSTGAPPGEPPSCGDNCEWIDDEFPNPMTGDHMRRVKAKKTTNPDGSTTYTETEEICSSGCSKGDDPADATWRSVKVKTGGPEIFD